MLPQRLRITEATYEHIKRTIGIAPAEQGGMLGGNRNDFIVVHFHLDDTATQTEVSYSPNYKKLNKLLDEEWNPAEINLLGFVHSHPPHIRRPSSDDLVYAHRILNAIPQLPYLLLPIIISKADTEAFELHPYAVVREGKAVRSIELALDVINAERRDQIVLSPILAVFLIAVALIVWIISKLLNIK